jgi:hypothetical protein
MQSWDALPIKDKVFIDPNMTFTNNLKSPLKFYPENFLQTTLRNRTSVGLGGNTSSHYT